MDLANNNVGGDRVGLRNDYSRCATLKNYRRQIWDAWTCVARPWSALHVRMRVLVSGSAVGASGDVHTQVFSGRKRVPRLGRQLKSDVFGELESIVIGIAVCELCYWVWTLNGCVMVMSFPLKHVENCKGTAAAATSQERNSPWLCV